MFAKDKLSTNAMGGTEIMKYALAEKLPETLLDNFQIFVSRVEEELSPEHIRILWLQDLAGDPASDHLHNGGWNRFHKLVFSSHWQMRAFVAHYNIPWSKCVVVHNSIEPIEFKEKNYDKIKLVYSSTPHRGLNILYSVFNKLAEEFDNIELDVFSSFNLYGWGERDKEYKQLFDALGDHPKINYHGSVPNADLRSALQDSHIFAYPSIWEETSCLCLMEAMSAGLHCVHSSYGALPETSGNWTFMYPYHEGLDGHATMFYSVMKGLIQNLNDPDKRENLERRVLAQKGYVDTFYNRDYWSDNWKSVLESILFENPDRAVQSAKREFVYRTS